MIPDRPDPAAPHLLVWLDLLVPPAPPGPGLLGALERLGFRIARADGPEEARRLLAWPWPWAAVVRAAPDPGPAFQDIQGSLSPATPVPWLLVPPPGTPPGAAAALVNAQAGVADWADPGVGPEELVGRVLNLVRTASLLPAARSRAALLEGQLLEDPKTGLHNERSFRRRLEEELERTRRQHLPVSLLLLDLDDFKGINDRTSYEFGDRVLAAVGEVLRENIRAMDVAARLGGDEFALLLPNTEAAEALGVAERIRRSAAARLVQEDGQRARLRMSLGVATWRGRTRKDTRHLFLEANEALKEAKRAGKGRIAAPPVRRIVRPADQACSDPEAGAPASV